MKKGLYIFVLLVGMISLNASVEETYASDVSFDACVESKLRNGECNAVIETISYANKEIALSVMKQTCESVDAPEIFMKNQCYATFRMVEDASGYRLRVVVERYDKVNDLNSGKIVRDLKLEGLSDMEKAVRVHEWLCKKLDYGKSQDSLNECLKRGEGKCDDYSMIYASVMNAAGVPTRCMDGVPWGTTSGHMWNMVEIGGKWYLCDVTNDDQDGNYDHFMKALNGSDVVEYLGDYVNGYRLCNGVDEYLSYDLATSDYFDYTVTADLENMKLAQLLHVSETNAKKAVVKIVQYKGKKMRRSVKDRGKILSNGSSGVVFGKVKKSGKNVRYLVYVS